MKLIINSFKVLKDAEFDFPDEGFVTIIGLNGAGKSTLLNSIVWTLFGGIGPHHTTIFYQNIKIERDSKPKRLTLIEEGTTMFDDVAQSRINEIFNPYQLFEVSGLSYQNFLSSIPFRSQVERTEIIQAICHVGDDSAEFEKRISERTKDLEREKIILKDVAEKSKAELKTEGEFIETDKTKDEVMKEIDDLLKEIRSISESEKRRELLKIVPEISKTSELQKRKRELETTKIVSEKFEKLKRMTEDLEKMKKIIESQKEQLIEEQTKFILSEEEIREISDLIEKKINLDKKDLFLSKVSTIIDKLDLEKDLVEQLKQIRDVEKEGFSCLKCGTKHIVSDDGEFKIDEENYLINELIQLLEITPEILELLSEENIDLDVESERARIIQSKTAQKTVNEAKKRKYPNLEKLESEVKKFEESVQFLKNAGISSREIDVEIGVITQQLKEELKYDQLRREITELSNGDKHELSLEQLTTNLQFLTSNLRFLNQKSFELSVEKIKEIDEKIKGYKEILKLLKEVRGNSVGFFNELFKEKVNEILGELFSFKVEAKIESLSAETKATLVVKGEETVVRELSGGEQQRVNIAFLIACREILETPLMILDESLCFIDPENYEKTVKFLKKISEKCLILLVTHKETETDHFVEL
jgi:ABC-type Mn2+/Zn2+ transport system ATPase subunit